VVAGFVLAAGFVAPAQAVSATEAELSVLHGIPGLTVDVYVNGTMQIDDFEPGDLAGPLPLAPGEYEINVTASDAADDSAPVLTATVPLEAGKSYTATANLTDAGEPTLNLFTNDIATTNAGEGRLTVRHIAAAPAVDILAGGTPVVEDLVNPDEATLNLPVGTVSASVALAGTTDPVIGPADVAIEDGKLTIVYAWGSAEDANLALAVQSITVGHTAPGGVNSGTAGYAAERDAMNQAFGIIGLAFALAAASVAVIVIRRARAAKVHN
jgi:hypothetical protein